MHTDLTIDDFTIVARADNVPAHVTWEELDRVMDGPLRDKFNRWMFGQTCVPEGVYPWDLERFLKGLPVID